jgi:hypothetical protein
MNQNKKTCECFWNKFGDMGGSTPPPGAIPM